MIGLVTIIFNDTVVATTDKMISYQRDNDMQKEYRFTNVVSLLTASLFCEEIEIIRNENIIVEIF